MKSRNMNRLHDRKIFISDCWQEKVSEKANYFIIVKNSQIKVENIAENILYIIINIKNKSGGKKSGERWQIIEYNWLTWYKNVLILNQDKKQAQKKINKNKNKNSDSTIMVGWRDIAF